MAKEKINKRITNNRIIEIIIKKSFNTAQKIYIANHSFNDKVISIIQHLQQILQNPSPKGYSVFKVINKIFTEKVVAIVKKSSLSPTIKKRFCEEYYQKWSFQKLMVNFQKMILNTKFNDEAFNAILIEYKINYFAIMCGSWANIIKIDFDGTQKIRLYIDDIMLVNVFNRSGLELFFFENYFFYDFKEKDAKNIYKNNSNFYKSIKKFCIHNVYKNNITKESDWIIEILLISEDFSNNEILFKQLVKIWKEMTPKINSKWELIMEYLFSELSKKNDIKKYYLVNPFDEEIKLNTMLYDLKQKIKKYLIGIEVIFKNENFYSDYIVTFDVDKQESLYKIFRDSIFQNIINLIINRVTEEIKKMIFIELETLKINDDIVDFFEKINFESKKYEPPIVAEDLDTIEPEGFLLDKINQSETEQKLALTKIQEFKQEQNGSEIQPKKADASTTASTSKLAVKKSNRVPKFQKPKVRDFKIDAPVKKPKTSVEKKQRKIEKPSRYKIKLESQTNIAAINDSLRVLSNQAIVPKDDHQKKPKKTPLDLIENFPDFQESLIGLDDNLLQNACDWWTNIINEVNDDNINELYEEINQKIHHLDNKKRLLSMKELALFEKIKAKKHKEITLLPIIILHRDNIRDKTYGRPAISLGTFSEDKILKEIVIVGTTRKITKYQHFHQQLLGVDTYFYVKDIAVITKDQNRGLWNEAAPLKLSSKDIDDLLTMITEYNEENTRSKKPERTVDSITNPMNEMWDNYIAKIATQHKESNQSPE